MPMQMVSVLPVLHALIFAKAATKTNNSGLVFFLLLIVAVALFFFVRPQRRRQRDLAAQQRAISVGDEVVTAAGIVGRVQSMTDERVRLEVAPGTTIEVVRRMIGQRIVPPEAPTWGGPTGGQWNFPSSSDDPDHHDEPPTGNPGGFS
ncbi:MAG TPA: preprotein translocase subunit YajC [Acidimicrobiales bacterium]|nr:preprotein translocase subunit YajC [Acidimicrobiales bacterium]